MENKLSILNILNKTQEELLQLCAEELVERGYTDILKDEQFLFAQGEIPIMLVAHLDTVHKTLPEIYFDRKKKVLWSPNGIGGDDRCGVYAILEICSEFKPYVLFTTDEEVGARGATAFNEKFKNVPLKEYVDFIIEIDRRGRNQAVFYQCDNKEFQQYILSFGFDKRNGSFSDISRIAPEFDIAAVNLSAGYYNEHTASEHIILKDLEHTIKKVKEILSDTENHRYYDFQRVKYEYYYSKRETAKEEYTLPRDLEKDFSSLSDEEWQRYYFCEKPKTHDDLKKLWISWVTYYDYYD